MKQFRVEITFLFMAILAGIIANVPSPVQAENNNLSDPTGYPDSYPPLILFIDRTDPNPYPPPANTATVTFEATFSEDVMGVGINDFVLTVTGVQNPSITAVSGSGNIYTITVNTGSGDGTIRLDMPETASVQDLSGNPLYNVPFTYSETYTIFKSTFEDVLSSHSFHRYIEAFYKKGITTGCSQSPKLFCPDNLVTRAEMAVFIERAMGNFAPKPNPKGMFTDLPFAGLEAFSPFIEEFYNDKITTGCQQSPLKFCPQNNVTRGEMAVF